MIRLVVTELVVGDQARSAITIAQHEGVGQLIASTILIGQVAFLAGSIPIGDKHVCLFRRHEARTEIFQLRDGTLELLIELRGETKLGDISIAKVVGRLNACCFRSVTDGFLYPVDVISRLSCFLSSLLLDGFEISWVDVLGSVNAEASNSELEQTGEKIGVNILNLGRACVPIPHRIQTAVLHFILIGVIGNSCRALMEIRASSAFRVLVLITGETRVGGGIRIKLGTCNAFTLAVDVRISSGGLVQHHISDDSYSCLLAGGNHMCEFSFTAQF